MKYYYTLLPCLFAYLNITAQIPSDYYDSASGLSGFALKTALKNITSNGHIDRGYNALYTAYQTTHTDTSYENDGTVLDFYSENPIGVDSYNYSHLSRTCGTQRMENDCYNREHLVPQSIYDEKSPMRTDVHQVIPSDGHVNNRRSNHAFGEVAVASFTSLNGSKVGSSAIAAYSGTVFEPIDEFKGDIARAILYFVTRYEDNMDTYSWFMFDGSKNKALENWAIDLLILWHTNDPVNDVERDRNDAAYDFQGNANPFVDHPEYVNMIWGTSNTTPDTENPSAVSSLSVSNETNTSIDVSWSAATDNIAIANYEIHVNSILNKTITSTNTTIFGLSANQTYSIEVIAVDSSGNKSNAVSIMGTTTNDSGSNTSCSITKTETFAGIPSSSGSYSERSWTGDNGETWTAIAARTDQTLIDGTAAITFDTERSGIKGRLMSSSISGGIGSLTVSILRVFGGSNEELDVKINGNLVGAVAYNGDAVTTKTISGINVEGDFVLELSDDDADNRIVVDNLSWTCYDTNLSTDSFNKEYLQNEFYPNPSTNGVFRIKESLNTFGELFDLNGRFLFNTYVTDELILENLENGIYFLKVDNTLVKLIKG